MHPETLTQPHPDDDFVDQLVAECLARVSAGDANPLEQLCAEHPEHAPELRRRHLGLAALGLWSRAESKERRAIGTFDLLRELGRGGMGVVYLAHQREPLRRLAAVKVIGGRASPLAIQRFEAEQRTLASLAHPNIAQVLEAGTTDDGEPWYAMEFVDGTTVTSYCAERRLPVAARIELFLQLCDAVQFAHQQGVLHRDLKPSNVLVCERSGKSTIKVIDFGLAKALQDQPLDTPDLTLEGQILGTPEYMSPEQATPGAAGVDTRADVYALGSMLYELLVGALPFDFGALRKQGLQPMLHVVRDIEAPAASVRFQQLGKRAEPVAEHASTTTSALLRRIRGDLDWITSKALQKDREQRYAGVSELAADVRRHLDKQPVQAGPPSTLYQLSKFVHRHRTGVTLAATALLGLVVALTLVAMLLVHRNESLARFDTLQLSLDLEDLERRVEADTWPALPEQLPNIDRWLQQANAITERLPFCHCQLATLEHDGAEREGGWVFDAPRDRFLHVQLQQLIARIATFAGQDGPLVEVAARREWAAGLRQRSLIDAATQWQAAIATIADRDRCPDYDGLVIERQLGFVPLGCDPDSKLYEFALLQPGLQLPQRGENDWVIAPDTCMVFVLIPGGEARLGIDWPDPRLPEDFVPFDVEYLPREDGQGGGRSFSIRLDPFLLSKYEMSQAQWVHLMGSNPSVFSPEKQYNYGVTLTHPVGGVSALMADEAVRRLGLQLPTSAQWQYAARARQAAPWWTGFTIEGWRGVENLADLSAAGPTKDQLQDGRCDTYDDTFALTAPVDSLGANPFGLHHVLGNVFEWSSDPAHKYVDAMPREDGDGAMRAIGTSELVYDTRDLLGGCCLYAWLYSRSTRRQSQAATLTARTSGLRPACRLASGE